MDPQVPQTAMLCTSCKEVLNNNDEIFGTSCGHLYHFHCLRECQAGSPKCSHCETYKPCMFRMFLVFGHAVVSWEDQGKTIELLGSLQECYNVIADLEGKYKISQNSVQRLEAKSKQFSDAINSKNTIISDLQDRVATLELRNDFLNEEIRYMAKQWHGNCSRTVESVANLSLPCGDQLVNNDNDKKLIHLSGHNEEEIINIGQIPKKQTQNSSVKPTCNETAKHIPGAGYIINHGNKSEENKSLVEKILSDKSFFTKKNQNLSEETESSNKSSEQHLFNLDEPTLPNKENISDSNRVAIRNYRAKDLEKYSLEETISYLATKMRLSLPDKEIKRVFPIQNNLKNFSLIVEFESNKYKQKFISNRKLLKKCPATKHLELV